jgi:hypothetical protein
MARSDFGSVERSGECIIETLPSIPESRYSVAVFS